MAAQSITKGFSKEWAGKTQPGTNEPFEIGRRVSSSTFVSPPHNHWPKPNEIRQQTGYKSFVKVWEPWAGFFFTSVSTWNQQAEVQAVFGSSLNTDHRLIRWSLDPAASSLSRGSWWSEKATLCTISVWYFSTASGCSFFHPNSRTRWSQPADARSFRSPLRHSWDTPGLTSVTQSWSWKSQESAS